LITPPKEKIELASLQSQPSIMKYEIGTTVYFLHTPDRGVITGFDGMYQVHLTDGFTIPAFEDDLCLHPAAPSYQPGKGGGVSSYGNPTFEQKFAKQAPQQPVVGEVLHAAGAIAQPRGIFCALEALPADAEGMIKYYQLWLCNEMSYPVIANLEVYFTNESLMKISQKMAPISALCCGRIHFDQLNDHPDLTLTIHRIGLQSLEAEITKTLRLRGKIVVNTPQILPIIDRPCWPVEIFNPKNLANAANETEDLAEYAKQMKPTIKPKQSPYVQLRDLKEIAAFVPEIDLHIEALMAHKGHMNNGEILRLQMMHFESFIDKAIRLNASNVFVIHGVGEGVLKTAIAERLRARGDVLKFKNQYHPKYGYGATEVWL
jgi:Smr domain